MTAKKPIDEQIVDFLKAKGTGTVDDIAAAVKTGRTSARKYLAGLTTDGKVNREPGGRDGRRKRPDVYSLPQKKRGDKTKAAFEGSKNGRLAPGELDKHVLAYMRKHKDEAPSTASAIGKAIKRSSGAVANCQLSGWRSRRRFGLPRPSRPPTSWWRQRSHEGAWIALDDYPDMGEAQIAETTLGSERLIVRRVRTFEAQGELFPEWRHFAFATNRVEAIEVVESEHREHAVVETHIAPLPAPGASACPRSGYRGSKAPIGGRLGRRGSTREPGTASMSPTRSARRWHGATRWIQAQSARRRSAESGRRSR